MAKKAKKTKFRMATGRGWRKVVNPDLLEAGDKFYNDKDNTWTEIGADKVGKPFSLLDYPQAKRRSKGSPVPEAKAAAIKADAEEIVAAVVTMPATLPTGPTPVTEHELPDAILADKPYRLHNIRNDPGKYAKVADIISEAESAALVPGQYAYLCFEKRGVQSERMWVSVRQRGESTPGGGLVYKGELANVPNHFDAKILRKGNIVTFSPCHVIKAVGGDK